MRRIGLFVVALLLTCAVFAADSISTSSSVLYRSANGETVWFQIHFQPNQQPVVDVSYGDTGDLGVSCESGPAYVCVSVGSGVVIAVPRDLRSRIPETMLETTLFKDKDRLKLLNWSTDKYEYRIEPMNRSPHAWGPVWRPVGFVGKKIPVIQIVVYKLGKVDRLKHEAAFLYNPEYGVLAFDEPAGEDSHGYFMFRSYWLEGKCGLIPLEPCHERPTR